jgi:hypothetical protein
LLLSAIRGDGQRSPLQVICFASGSNIEVICGDVSCHKPNITNMKNGIIGKILAVIMIVCAFYTFDYASFNKIGVSILLALNGINFFIDDSRSNIVRTMSKWCRRAMYLVMVVLVAKWLIFGF